MPHFPISGCRLKIGLQKGFLSVPADPTIPIVCVGPGTGIAPMRALIEHRVHDNAIGWRFHALCCSQLMHHPGNTLYFGCRSESKDHHYASEWKALSESQKLMYRVAFSRDGPEGVKRTYVQDLMREDAEVLWNIVGKRDGWVYISG